MAGNNINAEQQVEQVVKAWAKLEQVVSANVDILEKYSKNASNLPSSYIKQVEETRKAQDSLNKALEEAKQRQTDYTNTVKAQENIIKKTAKAKAQLSVANSKEAKEYHKLNEAKKAADKLNREEAKRLVATQGLYNKVQAGINALTKQYNDLALRRELNGKLSKEEEMTLGKLETKLNKYQSALRKVDANIGKHQRNVGNYKSSFDGLGFSVAQLSREMPAFANSMQTGFMAISNNIPMLVDEINKLKKANVELSASGKPTVSIFKQLGKAIFSWQSLISIGVTLLTVYGAKIFETIFAISEEEKALEKANKELKEQNKNLKDNISLRKQQLEGVKSFVNNKELLDSFRKVLNDLSKDATTSEAILQELADQLNKIGVDGADALTNQNILASDRVVIAANLLAIEEQKIKLDEERIKNSEIQRKQEEIIKEFNEGNIGVLEKNNRLQNLQSINLNNIIKSQKEIGRLEQANQDIISKTVEIQNKDIDTDLDVRTTQTSVISIESQSDTKGLSKFKELKESIDSQKKSIESLLKTLPELSDEYKYLEKQLELLNTATKGIEFGLPKEEMDEWSKNFKKQQQKIYDIQKEYAKKREQLERELSSNIKELGLSVADALFQAELNRLDKQARITEQKANDAIQFANGNAAAEERIREQSAERQAEIEEKRIEAERKAFLFNQAFKAGEIAIDTIKAVAALKAQASILLANPVTAPLASLALSQIPLVIATGATAGAAVLAQSIPAFWMGTEGTPSGTIMVNDDPFGIKGNNYKEVIKEPSGKLHFPQGKNVKMNVPKGSTVYPTYTDFNKELENVLALSGIDLFHDSITPNTPILSINNSGATAGDIDRIMGKHFSNIKQMNIEFNERGVKKYLSNGNSKTILHNNRTSGKGFSV